MTDREIGRAIEALDREKNGLEYAWLEAQSKRGSWSAEDYRDAERATKGRRREILDELRRLRGERKAQVQAAREDRLARAAANKAKKAADRGLTAECQICERRQCLASGRMVHHGYQRPGDGYILGDCMGVGHEPYPATDALVHYGYALGSWLENVGKAIAGLPALEEISEARGFGAPLVTRKAEADAAVWARKLEAEGLRLRSQERQLRGELARVETRISAAASMLAQGRAALGESGLVELVP